MCGPIYRGKTTALCIFSWPQGLCKALYIIKTRLNGALSCSSCTTRTRGVGGGAVIHHFGHMHQTLASLSARAEGSASPASRYLTACIEAVKELLVNTFIFPIVPLVRGDFSLRVALARVSLSGAKWKRR